MLTLASCFALFVVVLIFMPRHTVKAEDPTSPSVANDKNYVESPANPTPFYLTYTPSGVGGTATEIEAAPASGSITIVTGITCNAEGATPNQTQNYDFTTVATGDVEKQVACNTDKNGNMNQYVPLTVPLFLFQPENVVNSLNSPAASPPTSETVTVVTQSVLAAPRLLAWLYDRPVRITDVYGKRHEGFVKFITAGVVGLSVGFGYVEEIPVDNIATLSPEGF